jgi:hypothetical protein
MNVKIQLFIHIQLQIFHENVEPKSSKAGDVEDSKG